MKVTTLILATYILLLTFQPMFSALAFDKKNDTVECCSNKSCENEQSDKKNNKPEQHKQCNPFQACNSCVIYILNTPSLFSFSKPKISTKQNFTYQSVFTSQFEPDFWQPPKIV